MNQRLRFWKPGQFLLVACLSASLLTACTPPTSQPPTPSVTLYPTDTMVPTPTALPTFTLTLPSPTSIPTQPSTVTPEPTLPPTITPSPTAASLVVTATPFAYIRRGPGYAYNVVGQLYQGNSTAALGRNEKGDWVYVQLPPGQSSKFTFGWINLAPQSATLSGDVMSLPLATFTRAAPAYLRNCTYHAMLVKPGNVVLPPRDGSSNVVQFFPGEYKIYDQDFTSSNGAHPQVQTIALWEGVTADIIWDGSKKSHDCP